MEAEMIRLARPRRGHFDLGTGYHGDLWLDLDALFLRPALLRPYARRLADRVAEHGIDAVCGPLDGGAFLAQTMADLLGAAFLPAYRCSARGSPQLAGYRLSRAARQAMGGWRVALVDDAINAGTAVQACFSQLRDGGAVPVAVAALLSLGEASAMIAATMSLPCYAITTMPSSVWPAGTCPLCASGTSLSDG
jgi:orotate phosphoribosyltransferase